MKVAICGYPPLALQVQAGLQNSGVESKFFISDFVSGEGDLSDKFTPITFFEFRRLVNAGELDGLIIAEKSRRDFARTIIQICKFYAIPNVAVIDTGNLLNPVYFLNARKVYIPYLETNLVDGCNLNCKGCTHFSGIFRTSEVYLLETFQRDISALSKTCDIIQFRLLGGEPLLLKNLDEYIKISRKYLPKTNLRIVTNGLLIPSLPQKILDAIRENHCVVDISAYSPTVKIIDKIKGTLNFNKIMFCVHSFKEEFYAFLTLNDGNNPEKSQKCCHNRSCLFLRDGKIYKCPVDALSYRFAERFGLKNYPKATGVDIYAPNFSALVAMLDGNVEMCHWCSDRPTRMIPWATSNNPQLEDWLANPAEAENFA